MSRYSVRTRLTFLLFQLIAANGFAAEPIVIGQSLPLSDGSYVGRRIQAGAEAYVSHVNASGGIHGRPLRLVTLDDGGDPRRHADNLRSLAAAHALILINCLGDRACTEGARIAEEVRIPLVGPLSGSLALRAQRSRYVFPVRPGYRQTTAALAQQLRTIGMRKLAVLTTSASDAEPLADLIAVAADNQIRVTPIRILGGNSQSLGSGLKALTQEDWDAIAFDLDEGVVSALASAAQQARYAWPPMLLTLTSTSPTVIGAVFLDRMIGFVSVVPNPETSFRRLAADLVKQAERSGLPEAISFEGLEAYLNTKICVEALRRAGPRADAERLVAVLETLQFDAGDFPVAFGRGRQNGSDFLEIGLRTRDGKFVR